MRIAFISLMGGSPWGGSEALWSRTAILALKKGHQVFVSIWKWDSIHVKIDELKSKGAAIHFRNRYDPALPFLKKLKSYIKCNLLKSSDEYRELWKFGPDMIFINQGSNFDLLVHHYLLYEEIKRKNIAYSIICHGHAQFSHIPDKNIYSRGKEVFLNAKNVFFVSQRQKNLTERSLCTKLDNAVFTWNPLNLKEVKYLRWPEENVIQFAVVSALDANKGQDTLLEILSSEIWTDRQWHLNLYGEGYGKKYLIDLASWYGIRNRVTLHGYVSDINKVWENNHILLSPSIGEGLPISLCEAMACGRPAVVTDVGGNSEVIKENETGFIAPAPTVNSYSEALEKAWSHRKEWEEMGRRAFEFALKNFNLKPEENLLEYIVSK